MNISLPGRRRYCRMQFGEIDDRRKLMAITYNNMSCLFKRKGLLKTALGYAEKVPLNPRLCLRPGILNHRFIIADHGAH